MARKANPQQPDLPLESPPTPDPWELVVNDHTVFLIHRLGPQCVRTVASFGPAGDPANLANAKRVLEALASSNPPPEVQ
ncbi:MAG: hypothetical protein L0Z62_36470 [Gemmataceae bacterium]|nr:hypothetical protein [Gemmataceae bacterium]